MRVTSIRSCWNREIPCRIDWSGLHWVQWQDYAHKLKMLQASNTLEDLNYSSDYRYLVIRDRGWSTYLKWLVYSIAINLWLDNDYASTVVDIKVKGSRRYKIFWEVVGLERGPLSLVSTNEELLEIKSSGSGLENRECGRRDPSRWPRDALYLQRLALTSPTSVGRSV
jgi:hypothetical protein